MGRMGPTVGTVQHEGYVLPFFVDGVEGGGGFGGGSFGGSGVLVDIDRDEWRPDAEVVGWRAGCTCGWRGPDWARATGRWPAIWPASWGSVNARERAVSSDSALLEGDAERAVLEAWQAHVRPWMALEVAAELAERYAEDGRSLDTAVSIARSGGASWADIGRAVGITRQSARERWATKLGDGAEDHGERCACPAYPSATATDHADDCPASVPRP